MNDHVQLMYSIGKPMAAGFLEYPDGPLPLTYCRAYRRYYEACPIVYRAGAALYPVGNTTAGSYAWERGADSLAHADADHGGRPRHASGCTRESRGAS